MQESRYITVVSNRNSVTIKIKNILYICMVGKNAEIHVFGGRVYETRMTLIDIEKSIGGGFIKISRGCIVSARAIHDITDKVNLSNGESLDFTIRKKKEIVDNLYKNQQNIIKSFDDTGIPQTYEEYCRHYRSFDNLPFAFTDIEMVFNEERHAIDWIFRYGNPALAKLEKLPLEKLIGNSFGELFSNMDSKWLKSYERATLYGEIIEIMDFSPEIDTHIKVICFPTFTGHCGCMLFDINDIKYMANSEEANKTFKMYFDK